jgi:hypothetical protein
MQIMPIVILKWLMPKEYLLDSFTVLIVINTIIKDIRNPAVSVFYTLENLANQNK